MKDVYILAIESSCDETSASIIKNGYEDIATVINSQIDVHTKYGGVVPEVASRLHLENITMVIDECLERANMKLEDIAVILNENLSTVKSRLYRSMKKLKMQLEPYDENA